MTGTPIYLKVRLSIHFQPLDFKDVNSTDFDLLDKDVVLFPKRESSLINDQQENQPFTLHFELDTFRSPAVNSQNIQAFIHIADCFQTQVFQFVISQVDSQTQQPLPQTKYMSIIPSPMVMLIDVHGLHSPVPFLLFSVFLGSLYLVLFLAFLLLCLCKPKQWQFIVPAILFPSNNSTSRKSSTSSALTELAKSSTSALVVEEPSPYSSPAHNNEISGITQTRRLPVESIGIGRKFLIFVYVCFRAFTIFLFTFSVGLSLILSLEADGFKSMLSCVQNSKSDRIRELVVQETVSKAFSLPVSRRIASPWLQELKQIEASSDDELTRQVSQIFIWSTSR